MPLKININIGKMPTARRVPQAQIIANAKNDGNPNAANAAAYTRPILNIDQRRLIYDQRGSPFRREYRFRTGVLVLTLSHDMLIASEHHGCAASIWERKHEQDHVRDNQRITKSMVTAIKSDKKLIPIFIKPKWQLYYTRSRLEDDVKLIIGSIFKNKVSMAIKKRDTNAEYSKIRKLIFNSCTFPFYHSIEPGETLSKLALLYYQKRKCWKPIYNANKAILGQNPNAVSPGQRILIPRNPIC